MSTKGDVKIMPKCEDFSIPMKEINGKWGKEYVFIDPPAWVWEHPEIPDCPLATKYFSEWLIAIELTVAVMIWKKVSMPTNIGNAYSTHRMLYEANRLDCAKGIPPPEYWYCKVEETIEVEKYFKNMSPE